MKRKLFREMHGGIFLNRMYTNAVRAWKEQLKLLPGYQGEAQSRQRRLWAWQILETARL